ncbi:uncharacterized protein GLRG_00777 [Colletotrichum graminicola M1.001]|uniref:Uncharacterized protein n=1 Tax=Colletotrichum graminicola (strain M1.001 / M2 / FGSC 10212) TaxID=645133 RepID=E3Q3N1_COLGM|nr:uncharacterized protein GLRG_00777 [Colletotrichum graminicola M1.001]EFQ25633.1 hypothetical protein GLRG_00777 [Colletotrichum graminicola M1.001]
MNNGVDFTLYERRGWFEAGGGYQIRLGDAAMEGFESCPRQGRIPSIRNKIGQSMN